jgi:hypothetical protein
MESHTHSTKPSVVACPHCSYMLIFGEQRVCSECGHLVATDYSAEVLVVGLTRRLRSLRIVLLASVCLMYPGIHVLILAHITGSGALLLLGVCGLLATVLALIILVPSTIALVVLPLTQRRYKAALSACTDDARSMLAEIRQRSIRSLIVVLVLVSAYWLGAAILARP